MLFIEEKIDEFFIYYNEGYLFPLSLNSEKGIISFTLENKYYLDFINGEVHDVYKKDSVYTNDLLFPYVDKTYNITLKAIDCFSGFNEVTLDFNLHVLGDLIGGCNTSKYCLRRDYK